MREPPVKVRVLGHPLVALPVFGLCALALYGWSQQPDAWLLGVCAICAGLWTGKAQETANQYRRWRKAWDNMAEPAARGAPLPQLAKALIAVLVVGGFVLADQGGIAVPAGGGQALVGLAVLGIPAITLALLAKRLWSGWQRRAKRAAKTVSVRIAIARPILPAPDLKAAYDALPAHSWQVIEATRK